LRFLGNEEAVDFVFIFFVEAVELD
jgi:hypothetical protein